ncbi:hypothetical protein tb265_07670 [Gemmatimonadetes bacterium T265]|nr:hypothetical protein tb265_07670 [Gemmatimonadetes bacterium T265]
MRVATPPLATPASGTASFPRPTRVRRLGLAGRVFAGTAGVVVAVLVAALLAASASVRRAGDAAAQRGLEQAADLVAQFLAGRERALAGGARVFAQGPYFRALVAAERRDDVLDQTFEGAEQLGADWVFITDGAGRLLAKSDEPSAVGDALGGRPLVATALRGQVASGFGVSRDSLLFQAVAVPIAVPGAAPVGALVATKLVDDRLARDVRAATAADVVFYALDARNAARVAATSFEARGAARHALAAAGLATRPTRGAAAPRDRRAPIVVDGVTYLAQGGATTTAGGETVGGFVVFRRLDVERAELAGVQRSLLVAGGVGLVLALGAAWLTARRIARPVRVLADAARRATEGDYRPDDVLRASGLAADDGGVSRAPGDEIGALGAAVGALLADLRDRVALDRAALEVVRALGPSGADPSAIDPSGAESGRAAARGALRAGTPPRAARALALPHAAGAAVVPGAVLARRYALEAVLGTGGTGVVWRARDRELGETVAVKVLRPEIAATGGTAAADALERFRHELRLARRLTHRNIVRLHDLGRDADTTFLTMEYVEGASLAALLAAHGALSAAAVLGVAKQLARALEVAHAQGVVHGDLKPANLLLGAGGALKVADFGLARLVRAPAPAAGVPDIAGAPVGTPAFMAPELLLGAPPGVASDLYAAGVVLHACLTGETPFDGDTPVAFFARKLDEADERGPAPSGRMPAARPAGPAPVPADSIAAVIARLTAADPAARPGSARALSALLAGLR